MAGLGGAGSDASGQAVDVSVMPFDGPVLGRILVSAGDLDRDHSIVTFPPPLQIAEGKSLVLVDASGNQLPLQVDRRSGEWTFVLPWLGAGDEALFDIGEIPEPLPNEVWAAYEGEHIHVTLGQSPILRWVTVPEPTELLNSDNDVRAGYIYPFYSPAGVNVTDDYPVDHPSDHGIWAAWTKVSGTNDYSVDYYDGYAEQGHVDLESIDDLWSGPVHGGLVASLLFTDIREDPTVEALTDQWTVTVYKIHDGVAPYHVFDIDSTQHNVAGGPLTLEQRHDGGFAFRGSAEWKDTRRNINYLTSEGDDRQSGDANRARWCALWGSVGEQIAGLAALGHPGNVRHPQVLRIHSTDPFFGFVPYAAIVGGPYVIEVDEPYRTRFRVITYDGDADAELLERLWDDYATPPVVQVAP